ncbi:uncharacterized protein BDV14DRAFT_201088 [Aspergillus stella-maris]|uniref:uncharacterized protein n=1 Tax=Aspergillus stella-maris TaxID=1810926 RepID=UPI003CCE1FB7
MHYSKSTRSFSNLLTFALTILHTNPSLARDCYLMDGQLANTSHSPCTTSEDPTSHSPCCAKGTDTCLTSGLCQSSNGLIFETGCTDPTWESVACPSLCPDQSTNWKGKGSGNWTNGTEREYWQVMVCSSGVVCCRGSSGDESCCGDDRVEVEFDVGSPVQSTKTRTVTSTTTSTATSTESVNVAGETCGVDFTGSGQEDSADGATEVAEPSSSECKGRETTIGAAVGALLGGALVATLGAIWFLLQRQKKLVATMGDHQAGSQRQTPKVYSSETTGPITRNMARPYAELDAVRKYELSTEPSVSL